MPRNSRMRRLAAKDPTNAAVGIHSLKLGYEQAIRWNARGHNDNSGPRA